MSNIKYVFAGENLPDVVRRTVFLAGPSHRYYPGQEYLHNTWRHYVATKLESINVDMTVIIPIPRESFMGTPINESIDYINQIDWEEKMMDCADTIFMWVCRDIKGGLPGLTTNVELGKYFNSGRMIYGRPSNAEKVRYLDTLILNRDGHVFNDLDEMISELLLKLANPNPRSGGERLIPKLFWESEQFQDWYSEQYKNGNRILFFRPKSVITFNNDNFLFAFVAHIGVWIESEGRSKTNEWVFSRTATSYTIPYYIDEDGNRNFVLVSEFRTPANNSLSKVYEFPGGSAMKPGVNPLVNAAKELEEETGLTIEHTRFKHVTNRQAMATFCSTRIFVTTVELNKAEFEQIKSSIKNNKILGENEEERISLHAATEAEILHPSGIDQYPLDLSSLGMLYLAINESKYNLE